jgi:hypothetical protein
MTDRTNPSCARMGHVLSVTWSKDEAPPVPTLRHMVWRVNGNHTSETSHARKRYQESFRRTGGSAKMKMRSCCTEYAERQNSER